MALAGVVIGLVLALVAARWVQPLLFQRSATDPLVYRLVAGVMVAAALTASAMPTSRAARTDPNIALRTEGS